MSLNVGKELLVCEEKDMFFRARFQTNTCFETARAAWVLKRCVPKNNFCTQK